ncbi:MAG: HAD-IB family hydrolase [Robiginitomaculum sp.]|nr:MAG: HAD-IB family hydrolase [Robiginitomaculum sp.]
MTKQRIAIFDLDETLTVKGTWGRFVTGTLRGKLLKWLPFLASSLFSQALYMLRFGPREHVKENMMRWTLSGKTRTELEILADDFAETETREGLRQRAKSMIEHHRTKGDRIIIASAAVDLIVAPIAERLDIAEIVCTKMAYLADGTLSRKLGGMNCYGANKLLMVKEHLEQDPKFERTQAHITMYSDSRSDLDIMRWADVGIAVNPSPRLAAAAKEYGFDVQDWNLGRDPKKK